MDPPPPPPLEPPPPPAYIPGAQISPPVHNINNNTSPLQTTPVPSPPQFNEPPPPPRPLKPRHPLPLSPIFKPPPPPPDPYTNTNLVTPSVGNTTQVGAQHQANPTGGYYQGSQYYQYAEQQGYQQLDQHYQQYTQTGGQGVVQQPTGQEGVQWDAYYADSSYANYQGGQQYVQGGQGFQGGWSGWGQPGAADVGGAYVQQQMVDQAGVEAQAQTNAGAVQGIGAAVAYSAGVVGDANLAASGYDAYYTPYTGGSSLGHSAALVGGTVPQNVPPPVLNSLGDGGTLTQKKGLPKWLLEEMKKRQLNQDKEANKKQQKTDLDDEDDIQQDIVPQTKARPSWRDDSDDDERVAPKKAPKQVKSGAAAQTAAAGSGKRAAAGVDVKLTPELAGAVRNILTDILLKVTDSAFESVAQQCIKDAGKAQRQQVSTKNNDGAKPSATSVLVATDQGGGANLLGLGYDSDDSDSGTMGPAGTGQGQPQTEVQGKGQGGEQQVVEQIARDSSAVLRSDSNDDSAGGDSAGGGQYRGAGGKGGAAAQTRGTGIGNQVKEERQDCNAKGSDAKGDSYQQNGLPHARVASVDQSQSQSKNASECRAGKSSHDNGALRQSSPGVKHHKRDSYKRKDRDCSRSRSRSISRSRSRSRSRYRSHRRRHKHSSVQSGSSDESLGGEKHRRSGKYGEGERDRRREKEKEYYSKHRDRVKGSSKDKRGEKRSHSSRKSEYKYHKSSGDAGRYR